MITGGESGGATILKTELYDLTSKTSCTLPDLPEPRRGHSAHEEGIFCGGRVSTVPSKISNTCLKLVNGVWTISHNLTSARTVHCTWDVDPGRSFMLLGGDEGDNQATKTTELVFYNGTVALSFNLQYIAR